MASAFRVEGAKVKTEERLAIMTRLGLDEANASTLVRSVYPEADCFGPVNTFWPGQGERKGVWLVTTHPFNSMSFSSGNDEAEAWAKAADRVARDKVFDALIAAESETAGLRDLVGELADRIKTGLMHRPGCGVWDRPEDLCDCGFDALLEKAEEAKKPE